jgi:dimethylhistidine N-methyltransferase
MLDAAFATSDIVGIALAGLQATPKTLPPKLFYDAQGVRLFEAITRLPEYTLTRTELALLAAVSGEIAALAPEACSLVEYGASDEGKAAFLLDTGPGRFAAYVPIDIACEALGDMQARLRASRPDLAVHPICGDFLRELSLPPALAGRPSFGFFPGSTIGNLEPPAACAFLRTARDMLGSGAWLIVGAELRRDPDLLVPAYDDAQGVTAAFNLNLLHRLRREAAADFDVSAFRHLAVWNEAEGRIEMHIESLAEQIVHIGGSAIRFAAGETIHTENSYKHTVEGFRALAVAAGWNAARLWTDAGERFAIHGLLAP